MIKKTIIPIVFVIAAVTGAVAWAGTPDRLPKVFPIKSFSTDGFVSVTRPADGPLTEREKRCVTFPIPTEEGLHDRAYTGKFQDGDWGAWMDLSSQDGVLISRLNPSLDPNHTDGFGMLQLLGYTYLDGEIDLRDAELSFDVKGVEFERNSTEFYPWVQSCRYGDSESPTGAVCANWVLSSQPLGAHLETGEWEKVSVTLVNDADQWSYGGNRTADAGARYRYQYIPLNQTLASPINFHFVLALPKDGMPATGAVEFRNIRMCEKSVEHETADVSAPIRSLLMEYSGKPEMGTATMSIPPIVSVADREQYDVRVRVNPVGTESRLQLRQGATVFEDIYIGSQKTSRDVKFRDTALTICDDAEIVVSNAYGKRVYPLARIETMTENLKRRVACWWAE